MDKLSPSLMDKLNFVIIIFIPLDKVSYHCGQVISLMMSVLSQKICLLIVPVCRNGSNERSR
jgi:hypothetical protein